MLMDLRLSINLNELNDRKDRHSNWIDSRIDYSSSSSRELAKVSRKSNSNISFLSMLLVVHKDLISVVVGRLSKFNKTEKWIATTW